MILNVGNAVAIYFLIGLFIAGFYTAFDDDPGTFILITALWPTLLVIIAFIFVVAVPIMVGNWIGNTIKGWF